MATPADEIVRLHYYERQNLGVDDLEDEQTYQRDMRRRHNVGHHAWGIVTGLELQPQTDPNDATAVIVWLNPGMAVDGFGREIFVLERLPLDPSLFAQFASTGLHSVWIEYQQNNTGIPKAGFANCDATTQYGRIQEGYRVVVDPKSPTHEDINVGGANAEASTSTITLPADLSTPYQEFPEEATAPEWLVPLGKVNWDGANQKFIVPPADSVYLMGRSYAGVIAAAVYAPADTLVLQPRTPPADPDGGAFAEVNGRLKVDGRIEAEKNVLIQGGSLHFNDVGGSDDTVPLSMTRAGNPGGSGYDLRVHLGDSKDAKNRLAIGYKEGSEKTVLAVKADDTVDISTGSLSFGQSTRQMVNLYNQTYGIGVQNSTFYERTNGQFCWFRDGVHSDSTADPGSGGALLMRLDADANLHMGAQTRQMLNLWNVEYGLGVQAYTLYARSGFDFCWFKGGVHSDSRNDPGGGNVSMLLDENGNLRIRGALTVPGSLAAGGNVSAGSNLHVGGSLTVDGSQNIVSFFQTTLSIINSPGPTPWSCSFFGQFKHVYTAFAVLQGFSIWPNASPGFMSWGHSTDVNAIPQHVFVRVDGWDANGAHGVSYCQESLQSNEGDNTVLFSVIAIGIPA